VAAPCEVRRPSTLRPSKSAKRSFRRQCLAWHRGYLSGQCSAAVDGAHQRCDLDVTWQPRDAGFSGVVLAQQCEAVRTIQRFARGWLARNMFARMQLAVPSAQGHTACSIEHAAAATHVSELLGRGSFGKVVVNSVRTSRDRGARFHVLPGDFESAAVIIQKALRRRRDRGPLGLVMRRSRLLASALPFDGYTFLKAKVRSAAHASPDDYLDPAADLRAIQNSAAFVLQRAWRNFKGACGDDQPCASSSVLMGFSQEDLDIFSAATVDLLQQAEACNHVVSPAGELLIPAQTLGKIVQRVMEGSPFEPCNLTDFELWLKRTFRDCFRDSFVLTGGVKVDGDIVAQCFLRYLATSHGLPPDPAWRKDHYALVFVTMLRFSCGDGLPADWVI